MRCHLLQFEAAKAAGQQEKMQAKGCSKNGQNKPKTQMQNKSAKRKTANQEEEEEEAGGRVNWSRSSAERVWGWVSQVDVDVDDNESVAMLQYSAGGVGGVGGVQSAPMPGGCTLLGHRPLNWIGCGSETKRTREAGGGRGEEGTKSTEPSSRRHFEQGGGKGEG